MLPHEPEARREPLPAERVPQHRKRRSERVAPRDRDGADADLAARRERGHSGENGPRAGHEDESEADPEKQPVRVHARAPAREKEEGTLEDPAEPRPDQRRREN